MDSAPPVLMVTDPVPPAVESMLAPSGRERLVALGAENVKRIPTSEEPVIDTDPEARSEILEYCPAWTLTLAATTFNGAEGKTPIVPESDCTVRLDVNTEVRLEPVMLFAA